MFSSTINFRHIQSNRTFNEMDQFFFLNLFRWTYGLCRYAAMSNR